jgi:hypothetical protein
MMNITESFFYDLLLLSNAMLLAAAAMAVVRFRRQCERLERFWSSPTGATIAGQKSDQERLQLVTTMRLEKHIADLNEKVATLSRNDPRKQRSATVRQLPIENAVRMAKSGASVEDLTRTCGLNFGEARLLTKMHGS